ncbi:acyltransferase [Catellatospora sp. KI3]|uniref:acyltransferase family protein n=1 Tax=Catellatospora sp. KI3 TaxID=3041620 RepID=UPI002482BA13|nr:acyltransferase [Catellatospora sp. KI3]MDI1462251.1 acyltransferase [Catellatospora sp. KI3]
MTQTDVTSPLSEAAPHPAAPAAVVPKQRTAAEQPAEQPAVPTRAAPRLYVLDVLRFAAAMMVVSFHLVSLHPWIWGDERSALAPLHVVSRFGWLGVQLFFLISGFVICMSSWGRSSGEFFVSRAVRLYPAYWVAVLGTTALLTLWPLYGRHRSGQEVLANLTMLNGLLEIPHVDLSYWTLTVELVFYILFVFAVVNRGVTYRRVVVFCLTWTVVAVVALNLRVDWLTRLTAADYAPYFVAGMALYLIHRFGANLLLWSIVGMSWLLAMVIEIGKAENLHRFYPPLVAIITAFFLIMIGVALGKFSWVRWSWLTTVGALTYPLYLIHHAAGATAVLALGGRMPAWATLALVVAGLLAAAWLIHRYVETKMARWMKQRLTASLRQLREAGDPESTRQG